MAGVLMCARHIGIQVAFVKSASTLNSKMKNNTQRLNAIQGFLDGVSQLEESLSVKFSEDEAAQLMGLTIEDALLKLDTWLGPEEPTDGLLTLTEDQFIRRYNPETTPQGEYYRQREWYDSDDANELRRAVSENRCWTMVDDDDGNPCIDWGNRVVNRIYNIITALPIENPDWIVQVPYEEDVEDNEEVETEA
jgi:hypothetical protein